MIKRSYSIRETQLTVRLNDIHLLYCVVLNLSFINWILCGVLPFLLFQHKIRSFLDRSDSVNNKHAYTREGEFIMELSTYMCTIYI